MNLTSAAGVLAMLDEKDPQLKCFALNKLNAIVGDFWPEISDAVDKIEMLYEDESFPYRELSALVTSKVYYHLGAYEISLTYALGAGNLFDVNSTTEYVETTISKCIDHYTKLCVAQAEGGEKQDVKLDSRLEDVVNRKIRSCLENGNFKQAVGIALETRRIDVFEEAIMKSDDVAGMLLYASKVCMSLIQNRQFRSKMLRVLVRLYLHLDIPDYINVCQCLIFLDDASAVAEILEKLIKGTEDQTLMAYQIGFDLYESATQQYLSRVMYALRAVSPIPLPNAPAAVQPPGSAPAAPVSKDAESQASEEQEKPASVPPPDTSTKYSDLSEEEKKHVDRLTKLLGILGGETSIAIHLQFLIRNNHTDMLILKNTKDAVRNSVCHTATVICNSFMYCGTTSDQFLRDNLEWLARATNWARFTATASLGVIHRGHEKEALHLMSTYLPKDTGPGSAYSEGGGLYALGLIHANHGGTMIDYLLNQVKEATTEMVRHGAGLGLGLAAMGTARQDVYEQLKFNLYQDDAVTGEAAGIAMGLVMVGTKSAQAIEDMVAYAQETQHEKILRGLAIGIALCMYGRLEEADTLIESLSRDKDPILRRSGMYTIAMAYCGSGSNQAIRKLLHVAVSDVNDDVRRAAVEAIGFILFRTPEQCPSVVSLLSESYNPHVRYGAAMALGVACAGTGNKEAVALIEPMTNDPVNYVRQGAMIASALILVQQTEAMCPKVKTFRELYTKVINDKHDDVIAKFGAILAQGIIDAGGRNVTISLQTRNGHTHMESVVGMLVFTQFWFWYPLSHFLSLAFTPTAMIALNAELQMPKVEFKSNAKSSMFAYPPLLEPPKEKEKEKVSTAVLSITAKAKARSKSKKGDQDTEKMEVDEVEKKDEDSEKGKEEKAKEEKTKEETTKDEKTKEEAEKDTKDSKEPKEEASFSVLQNPARALPAQLKVLSCMSGRYHPLKPVTTGGIILCKDQTKGEPEEIVETLPTGGPKAEDEEPEPPPPEPFQYTED
ncbi:26S proteasome non-ATPase regulatory subunit 1-like [Branchiostoma floridae x Branchiostoma belcheri]